MIILPWLAVCALGVTTLFLSAKERALSRSLEAIKIEKDNFQNLWAKECERRAIAEEKAGLLAEFEKEKLVLLQQAQERLSETFKALSSEALNHNIQSFLELATTRLQHFHEGAKSDLHQRQLAIDALLKPIQTSLQAVDLKIGDLEKARLAAYSTLT